MTVHCKAQNPNTCRYHGSTNDYDTLNLNLVSLKESIDMAKSLDEVIRIKQEMKHTIEQIDTTNVGYSQLVALHHQALKSNNFAESVLLEQRIQAADKIREEETAVERAFYAPDSQQGVFFKAIEDSFTRNKVRSEAEHDFRPAADPAHYYKYSLLNQHVEPKTLTELRKALKNGAGVQGSADAIREVTITGVAAGKLKYDDHLEIHGPKDGRPLIVHNQSGFQKLKIVSGNVVVYSNSASGNPVEVDDNHQGEVVIIAGPDRKVNVSTKKKINIIGTKSRRVSVDSVVDQNVLEY